eukprot:g137.t1
MTFNITAHLLRSEANFGLVVAEESKRLDRLCAYVKAIGGKESLSLAPPEDGNNVEEKSNSLLKNWVPKPEVLLRRSNNSFVKFSGNMTDNLCKDTSPWCSLLNEFELLFCTEKPYKCCGLCDGKSGTEPRHSFASWLSAEKGLDDIVKEMSPDNAWSYLASSKLLVVLLVESRTLSDPKSEGNRVFRILEDAALAYKDVANFVWAEASFASQFNNIRTIPAVVIVETATEKHATFDPLDYIPQKEMKNDWITPLEFFMFGEARKKENEGREILQEKYSSRITYNAMKRFLQKGILASFNRLIDTRVYNIEKRLARFKQAGKERQIEVEKKEETAISEKKELLRILFGDKEQESMLADEDNMDIEDEEGQDEDKEAKTDKEKGENLKDPRSGILALASRAMIWKNSFIALGKARREKIPRSVAALKVALQVFSKARSEGFGLLVESPHKLQKVLKDPVMRKDLFQRIEKRSWIKFELNMLSDENAKLRREITIADARSRSIGESVDDNIQSNMDARIEELRQRRLAKDSKSRKLLKTRRMLKRQKILARRFYDSAVEAMDALENAFLEEAGGKGEGTLEPNRVQKTIEIDRIDASNLSLHDFVRDYENKRRPVIISGLDMTNGTEWTLDYIREKCNNPIVNLQKRNQNTKNWGGLVRAGKLRLNEFIDTFRTNITRRTWYLHDWSMSRYCSAIFGKPPYSSFQMPKYFAGDYFQRVPFSGYQGSWPSLFIGANGTESAMHVDSGATNFWLYLLSGKKEWVLYDRDEIPMLNSVRYTPRFEVNAFTSSVEDFPLLRHTNKWHGMQYPGDLVFIPAGCPHAVRNLDNIHGLSMNYVDASNIWQHLQDRLTKSAFANFETMVDSDFPKGYLKNMSHMTWGEFKSTDWRNLPADAFEYFGEEDTSPTAAEAVRRRRQKKEL